ncbi:MAG: DNA helicase UvrBC [Candidatus Nealsonbacteria bacterium]|nr:DNA helicase UvrBC [Candidatus Nealsonbacteria bacterium]
MSESQDIDQILKDWPYQPGVISARLVHAGDGREVLQMRIEMGLLQLETTGRPDGSRPDGADTYLDCLLQQSIADEKFVLDDDQCFEIDREFLQFYHRRIGCLALREFRRAVADADHTLALMDLAAKHSSDREWMLSHERYRPFVHFHRTQAAAMEALRQPDPEAAIAEISQGLDRMREVFEATGSAEEFDAHELVVQLVELKEALRKEYDTGLTLAEQLSAAVANEEYERAAMLRDEMERRSPRPE